MRLLLFITLLFCEPIFAQVSCPPNINFEFGSTSNWHCGIGSCCPININSGTGAAVPNRHVITSGSGLDPYGNFPVVSPYGGGNYSLKLGNASTGAQSENIRYTFTVPNNANTSFALIYHYAVVFEDPNHAPADQPRFTVSVKNATTNAPLPCNNFTYIATSNLPGFSQSPVDLGVYYKPWSLGTIDLSGLNGQSVVVEFATGDCDLGGHFGYGYVDVSCGLFQIATTICNTTPNITLSAPPGYATYKWYDSSLNNLVGTGANVTIPSPTVNTIYKVVLTPYTGYGCPDTLETIVSIANVNINESNDTTVCQGDVIPLFASASGMGTTYSYNWTPSTQLSCSNCSNPIFTATDSTKLIIQAVDNFGCNSYDSIKINVKPKRDSTLYYYTCTGGSYNGITTSGVYSNTYSNAYGCDSTFTLHLFIGNVIYDTTKVHLCAPASYQGLTTSGVYIDTVNIGLGCDSIHVLVLDIDTASVNVINHVLCDGQSFYGYTQSGVYTDVFNQSSGCDSIRIINLTVNPTSRDTTFVTICQGDVYQGYNTSGYYALSYQNIYGCDSIQVLALTVSPLPTLSINSSPATSVCQGIPVTLTASGAANYSWTGGVVNGITFIPTISSIYTVTGTNSYGCSSTKTVSVQVTQAPTISVTNIPVSPCPQGQTFLSLSGANSYLVTPGNYTASQFIQVSSNTTYTITGTTNGCSSSITHTINTLPTPIIQLTASPSNNLCAGNTLTITGSGASTYTIQPNGLTLPAIFAPALSSVYTVTATSSNGCLTTKTIAINIITPSISASANPTGLCQGGTTVLNATGGNTYTVLPGNYPIPASISPSTTTVYTIIGTDAFGCTGTSTTNINVFPLPSFIQVTDSMNVCQGSSVILSANAGSANINWSNSINNNIPFIAQASNTYTVTATTSQGCTTTSTTTIYVKPRYITYDTLSLCAGTTVQYLGLSITAGNTYTIPNIASNGCDSNYIIITTVKPAPIINLQFDRNICKGDRLNITNFGNTVPSKYNYVLHGATDIIQNQNQISGIYNTVGKFRIDITIDPDNNCPSVQGYDSVEVHQPIAEILIPERDALCKNQRIVVRNSANRNYSFEWQPSIWQNEGVSAWAIINDSANIYLKVTDPYNCENHDTARIGVINCCYYYAPNAFTPNQDGLNDWFTIKTGSSIILEDFKIMNRYGEIIFATNDITKGWDGTYKGKHCDHGTYFYYLKYSCDGVIKEDKGDISLYR